MTFNVHAIPFAVLTVALGIAMWVFRVQLMTFSDNFSGRIRTDAERKKLYLRFVLASLFMFAGAASALFWD